MPDRYEPLTEEQMRAALAENRWQGRQTSRDDFELAIDFLEGRQRAHVEQALSDRFPRRQATEQPIRPITIPLTRRYVTEAADAYNREVHREVVDDDGAVDEKTTEELNAALAEISYDQHMHRVEQMIVLMRSACNWYQVKRGKLRPRVVLPHDVYPILSNTDNIADPSDIEDYLAQVVELTGSGADARSPDKRYFAWVSPAETAFYSGSDPFEIRSQVATYENPFLWPQIPEAAINDPSPAAKMLPLSPIVWWNDVEPIGGLVNENDADLARLNLEINVQLSILFDTIGRQGWSQLVMQTVNPESPPSVVQMGVTSAISIGREEAVEYLTGAAPYDAIVAALRFIVQLEALAHRQSPHDFSIDGPVATSGFAKMVDSLPKLEARGERTTQLTRIEATQAWPRLATQLSYLGKLSRSVDQLAKLHLRTRFGEVKFPETATEQSTRETHELDKGLVSRAVLIARREGISEREAEERLAAEAAAAAEADGEPGRPGLAGPGLDDKVQDTALSGVQVTSMIDAVSRVASGELPRGSGIAILKVAFQLDDVQAQEIMDEAGGTFTPSIAKTGQDIVASKAAPPASPPTESEAKPPPEPPPEPPKKQSFGDVLGGLIGRKKRD